MVEPTLSPTAPDAGALLRRWVYLLIIAVAGIQGVAAISTTTLHYSPTRAWPRHPIHSPMLSANDRSRWCTVWSLVERGTYQIDEIIEVRGWNTIDKGKFQGHFYSSKPPFLSTLVAGIYWPLKRVFGLDLLTRTHETVQTILFLVNGIPWLVALWLLAQLAERYGKTDWSRLFFVAAAAFGTFLSTFLITLNNHNPAACSVVFALWPLLQIVHEHRRDGWAFAAVGFWGAFAVCCEIPAAPLGVLLFVALYRCAPRQTLTWFVPAAAIPLLFFFATNWLCTGGLMPFYSNFGAPHDTFYKYGPESYWNNPQGVDVGDVPVGWYLFHCTFGHHGIFSLSPIFLLSLATWMRLRRPHPLRLVSAVAALLTIWNLVFWLRQTHNYNYGGVTSGLRWAFWLIPFWLLSMIPVLDEWSSRRWFRILCLVFLGVSVYSVVFPRNNPWQHPWLMNLLDR
jgi:hypothetical protein